MPAGAQELPPRGGHELHLPTVLADRPGLAEALPRLLGAQRAEELGERLEADGRLDADDTRCWMVRGVEAGQWTADRVADHDRGAETGFEDRFVNRLDDCREPPPAQPGDAPCPGRSKAIAR
jgi:hypothetical protein